MPMATKSAPPPLAAGPGELWRASPSLTRKSGELGRARRSVKIFVCRGLTERAARLLHQVGLDELVDVAVQDAVHVAHLLFGPMILHHLIRVQDVAANLAAESDFLLGAADLFELRLVLFDLDVVKTRLQHFHRRVAVAMLRPLVLA